ncbi:CBO0543 family protein [Tuberibacillus sp. Marseille-P3662]|uniref:CBO0543 family protein n=1 Tax=Tuberibacillus sp. Marseille-P3662 TaxID=1965358 RepID=UPI000A1CB422|nr:CBO0543 family protein [Tuberibacillus sp. Marseille-P3662]
MSAEKAEFFNRLVNLGEKLSDEELHYWKAYSDYDTWQFWVNILMLVVPLIILLCFIDREKIFLLGFYGMNIDAWFTYLNLIGVRCGLWDFPNRLAPIFPFFSFSASLIPVIYILVYQWTLNHNKNYYIYTFIISAIISFIMMPIFVVTDFFKMFKWVNYAWLFVFIVIVFLWSKIITNVFIFMHKKSESMR